MKKVVFTSIVMVALAAVSAFGQSGTEIDTLLGTSEVSIAAAARFVMPAADLMPADVKADAAFTAALEKGWLPADVPPESPIKLAALSFLVMKAFDLPGGAMYRLISSPRYAYRELLYLKILQGISDPAQTVSGERLMRILGRVLDHQGGES